MTMLTSPALNASGALMVFPVNSIYADIFLGTTLAKGMPGVEQNKPTLLPGTENLNNKLSSVDFVYVSSGNVLVVICTFTQTYISGNCYLEDSVAIAISHIATN